MFLPDGTTGRKVAQRPFMTHSRVAAANHCLLDRSQRPELERMFVRLVADGKQAGPVGARSEGSSPTGLF